MIEILKSVPALLALIFEFLKFVKPYAGDGDFLRQSSQAFGLLNKAKTSEEKKEAARLLSDIASS